MRVRKTLAVGAWLRGASSLSLCAVSAALVASACGSSDGKKKSVTYSPDDGGQPSAAGSTGEGDSAGRNSGAAEGGAPGSPVAGASSMAEAGAAPAGAAGAAGAGPGDPCRQGFGDCDDDPSDCETPLNLVTSCGACGVSCSSENGASSCQEESCVVTSCDAGFGDCNATGNDGCESALDTAAHCGSCDNDCGSATCNVKGYCDPVSLGSSAYNYRSVMAGDSIYRLKVPANGYAIEGSYTLIRTPLDGSAEVIMDDQAKGIGGLTADANYVYWGVAGTPAGVYRKALTAAAAAVPTPVFAPVSLPLQMRIQGSALYFIALDGNLYTRSMSALATDPGAAIVSNIKGTGVFSYHQDLAVTSANIYWIVAPNGGNPNQGFLRSAPIAGGPGADVPGAVPKPWSKLAVSGEDLYFVQADNAAFDGVYHYKAGGSVEGLVFKSNLTGVAVDGDSIYFLEGDTNLYKAPVAGGVGTLIGVTPGLPKDIVGFDAQATYLAAVYTHGSGFAPGTSYILPK